MTLCSTGVWNTMRLRLPFSGICYRFILPAQRRILMQDLEIKEMLADLIWLNALIATELIQVTENTSAILRKSPPPESCLLDCCRILTAASRPPSSGTALDAVSESIPDTHTS